MKYEKPPLPTKSHLELLKQRGLSINNEVEAYGLLESIGYYRLSGYMYHLQSSDGKHSFFEGVTFEQVISTYLFDKKLRLMLLDSLETIEVSVRALMTNRFSLSFGFFWFGDVSLYDKREVFDLIQEEIHKSIQEDKELFIRSFKSKYTSESLPPSNMALELLSFGKLARLYDGLKSEGCKNDIASTFGLPSTIFSTWLIYLNNVRNVCAHHGRLWNRRLTADRPKIPTREKYKFTGYWADNSNTTLYGVITLIVKLLDPIAPNHSLRENLIELIDSNPQINVSHMGFPKDWKKSAEFLKHR
jgi:abortive infection bacteriophage resistance protein